MAIRSRSTYIVKLVPIGSPSFINEPLSKTFVSKVTASIHEIVLLLLLNRKLVEFLGHAEKTI